MQHYNEHHITAISDVGVYRQRSDALLTDQLDKTKRRIFGFAKTLVVKLAETGYSADSKKVEEAEEAWTSHLKAAEIVGIGSIDISKLAVNIASFLEEPPKTFLTRALRACEISLLIIQQSGTVEAEEMAQSPVFLGQTTRLVYSVFERLKLDYPLDEIRACPLFTALLCIATEITRCIFEMGYCAAGRIYFLSNLRTSYLYHILRRFGHLGAARCRMLRSGSELPHSVLDGGGNTLSERFVLLTIRSIAASHVAIVYMSPRYHF